MCGMEAEEPVRGKEVYGVEKLGGRGGGPPNGATEDSQH